MFFNSILIYLIPFIGIILIIISLSLSNTRNLFIKRKKRSSINDDTQNSHITIEMNSYIIKYIPNLFQDDEELMESDTSLKFCDTHSIELRVEQDIDFDNDN